MSSYTARTSGLASLYSISPNVDIFFAPGNIRALILTGMLCGGKKRYAVKSCRARQGSSTLFLPLANGPKIPAKRPTVKTSLLSHGSLFALLMAISGTAFPAGGQTIHIDITPAKAISFDPDQAMGTSMD